MLKNSNNLFDRTSLYRTIDLFIKLGIAERINIGWKYKIELSDKFSHHHHHLTCINCHKIIDIPEESYFEDYINNLAKKNNFAITRHQIEIEGLCQNCKKV